MAKVTHTITKTVKGVNVPVLVYDNGMERRADNGHMVKPPPSAVITSEKAFELQRTRQEQKRAAVTAAANAAVERGDLRRDYGDLAFVAAITETAMLKATTADDPKAIDAARFVLQEAGIAEAQARTQAVTDAAPLAAIGALLMEYVRTRAEAPSVVDGDVLD